MRLNLKGKKSIAMGKGIACDARATFTVLLWASFVVACTASEDLPPPGESTPSANTGAMMRVVPPDGGTPVPVHLYTPPPKGGQAPPPASVTKTQDFVPDATKLAQRDPPVLTLAGAQDVVPFPVRVAQYLPEGHELDPWLMVLPGPLPGSDPRGVVVRYIGERDHSQSFPSELMVEQYLGEGGDLSGGLTPSAPEMIGDFEAQVYEIPEAGVVRLVWRDPDLGVIYDVQSTLDKEETLRIVGSFE